MNDAARILRAQKSYSTDPDYLERMACAAESRSADPTHNASAEGRGASVRKLGRPPRMQFQTEQPGSRSNLSSNRASDGSTPAGLAQLVKSDSERWADIVKQTDFNPSD
jgi:hypothetical protein